MGRLVWGLQLSKMLRLSLMKSYAEVNPDLSWDLRSLLPTTWKHSHGRCLAPGAVVRLLVLPDIPKLVIQLLCAQARRGKSDLAVHGTRVKGSSCFTCKEKQSWKLVPWGTLPKTFQNGGKRLDFF